MLRKNDFRVIVTRDVAVSQNDLAMVITILGLRHLIKTLRGPKWVVRKYNKLDIVEL